MRRHPILKIAKVILIVALFTLVFSFFVMRLWNWLMPALFGLRLITYWHALGILVLSKILFGGFRGRGGPPWRWRQRMMERWDRMTPEEREKFRQGMQTCWRSSESKEPTK